MRSKGPQYIAYDFHYLYYPLSIHIFHTDMNISDYIRYDLIIMLEVLVPGNSTKVRISYLFPERLASFIC